MKEELKKWVLFILEIGAAVDNLKENFLKYMGILNFLEEVFETKSLGMVKNFKFDIDLLFNLKKEVANYY